MVFKNKKHMEMSVTNFRINQEDWFSERHERMLVQSIANAVGLSQFEDTTELHGKVFSITIWGDGVPMMFSLSGGD
jgi:hypothetical protein